VDAAVLRDERVRVHVGQSHEVLSSFPSAHFDWIYIDVLGRLWCAPRRG
jgi:hypothetical protein